jgi:hypothetical protein
LSVQLQWLGFALLSLVTLLPSWAVSFTWKTLSMLLLSSLLELQYPVSHNSKPQMKAIILALNCPNAQNCDFSVHSLTLKPTDLSFNQFLSQTNQTLITHQLQKSLQRTFKNTGN